MPLRWVLGRDPAEKFAPQARWCTDLHADPVQIVSWLVLRWQLETTFQAIRTHLGVETQRQWNALALTRTTPARCRRFAVATLLAPQQVPRHNVGVRQAAW